MVAPRNMRSLLEKFPWASDALREAIIEHPRVWFEEIKRKASDLPQTNFDLGCYFAQQDKLRDAVLRFRITLYLKPNFPDALYNLGCCYVRLGQRGQAEDAFRRTLQLQPQHEQALLMLSGLNPHAVPLDRRPKRMPPQVVKEFFDSVAERYDSMEQESGYQGGQVCFNALRPQIGTRSGLRILDLGCGIGHAAMPWRGLAAEITGIDFAPAMVRSAQTQRVAGLPLFDRVLNADLLQTRPEDMLTQADIVLCCNVAPFLGDLSSLLKILGAMKAGAYAALTIEPAEGSEPYRFDIATGRFRHRAEPLAQQAQSAGFTLHQSTPVELYPGTSAHLMILSRSTA